VAAVITQAHTATADRVAEHRDKWVEMLHRQMLLIIQAQAAEVPDMAAETGLQEKAVLE